MRKGLAASTLRTYDFAWRTFAFFCVSVGISLKPVLIPTVCAFMCYCATVRHLKPQYIRGLLAGVQFNIRCFDPSFPSLLANQSVKLILRGLLKTFPPVLDRRRPITLSTLRLMLSKLREGLFSPYIDALLDAAFLLAFYAFLRPGEFTTASLSFNPNHDVCLNDLSFHASHFSLSIKHSKCGGACSIHKAKSDRLRVTENCSLGIKKVTEEDAGVYTCRQFSRSGKQQSPESEVLLNVVTMTEHQVNDEVTLKLLCVDI
ncbi:hypothetical protein JOQ06_027791 [Pogonophryne albipinna]|uniref:Ig-like domain-containing protein n=1 Tax=Pogonophryne albipinna TaxID=1090488 RepID=A0AAD6F611_9TELE|nr:hypothetical protein JOQ06_027791 [Pogonophryne albipinna]